MSDLFPKIEQVVRLGCELRCLCGKRLEVTRHVSPVALDVSNVDIVLLGLRDLGAELHAEATERGWRTVASIDGKGWNVQCGACGACRDNGIPHD